MMTHADTTSLPIVLLEFWTPLMIITKTTSAACDMLSFGSSQDPSAFTPLHPPDQPEWSKWIFVFESIVDLSSLPKGQGLNYLTVSSLSLSLRWLSDDVKDFISPFFIIIWRFFLFPFFSTMIILQTTDFSFNSSSPIFTFWRSSLLFIITSASADRLTQHHPSAAWRGGHIQVIHVVTWYSLIFSASPHGYINSSSILRKNFLLTLLLFPILSFFLSFNYWCEDFVLGFKRRSENPFFKYHKKLKVQNIFSSGVCKSNNIRLSEPTVDYCGS